MRQKRYPVAKKRRKVTHYIINKRRKGHILRFFFLFFCVICVICVFFTTFAPEIVNRKW